MPVPQTSIRTSHAVSIRAGGVTVGQIQTWAPNQSRTVTAAYQLASTLDGVDSGEVTENIPGNVTGLTIQVSRYDLFASKMEQVWGTSTAFYMLSSQYEPLEILEKWSNPDNTSEQWNYSGCWFSQLGRNLQAQGDRIVMVNATLSYVKARKVL
jgi:hypothetical protein